MAASTRDLSPLISINMALPSPASSDATSGLISLSLREFNPNWPRQRLTLFTSPPPAPVPELMLTAAWEFSGPGTIYFAVSIEPGSVSRQPAGTCQLGFPPAAGAEAASGGLVPPTGG